MRRELPVAITFVAALIMLFDYFTPQSVEVFHRLASESQNWGIVISAFAIGLGAVNLMQIHGKRLREPRTDSVQKLSSFALIAGLWAFILIRIFVGKDSSAFEFMFTNLYSPMGSAMFAMLVFYIASAAYRAFRFRNVEATVLLITGLVVMFGNAPIAKEIWSQAPDFSAWLIKVPNVAGQRGILIGAAVGAVSTSLRVMLGIERGHLGGGNE